MPHLPTGPRTSDDEIPDQRILTDYSFTLQAVMDLQKTIGGLTEAVTNLKIQSEKQADKLDRISLRVHTAAVLVTVAIPIIAFLANWLAPIVLAAIRSSVVVAPK